MLLTCEFTGAPKSFRGSLADKSFLKAVAQAHVLVAFLLLAFFALNIAYSARRKSRRREWWLLWVAGGTQAYDWLRSPWRAPSPEEAKLSQLIDERFVDFWSGLLKTSTSWIFPGLLYHLLNYHMDGVLARLLNEPDAQTVVLVLTQTGFSAMVWACAWCIYFMFPRTITKRALYIFILLTYVRLCLQLAVPMELPQFQAYLQMVIVIRICITLHCPDLTFVFSLNLISGIVMAYFTVVKNSENNIKCTNMTRELVIFVLAMSAHCITRLMIEKEVRGTLAAKASRSVETSVEWLLSGMCDAVVHLQKDLTLHRGSEKLDALLLRQKKTIVSTDKDAEGPGLSFLDLLHQEIDRDKFSEFCQQTVDSPASKQSKGLPPTLHITMRDMYQTPVPIQIFCASYLDTVDELMHIVGIRETGTMEGEMPRPKQPGPRDEPEAPEAPMALDEPEAAADGARPDGAPRSRLQAALKIAAWATATEHGSGRLSGGNGSERARLASSARSSLHSNQTIDEVSCSSVESSDEGIMPMAPLVEYSADEVAVWIDPYRTGLPMSQCTPAFFTYFGGPSLQKDVPLISWMPRKSRKTIVQQVHNRVNELVADGGEETQPWLITLQPRHLALHQVRMNVVISAPCLPPPNASGYTQEEHAYRITLLAEASRVKIACRNIEFLRLGSDRKSTTRRKDSAFLPTAQSMRL